MCTRTLPKHTHAQTRIRTHTYSFSVCLTHTRTRTHERTLTRTHTHSLRLPAITNVLFVLYIQAELFLNEHRQQVELTTSKFRLGNPRRILGIHRGTEPTTRALTAILGGPGDGDGMGTHLSLRSYPRTMATR